MIRHRSFKGQIVSGFQLVATILAFLLAAVILVTTTRPKSANPCAQMDPPIPKWEWCARIALSPGEKVILSSQQGDYTILLNEPVINDFPAYEIEVKHPGYPNALRFYDANRKVLDLVTTFHIGDIIISRWKDRWYVFYSSTGKTAMTVKGAAH